MATKYSGMVSESRQIGLCPSPYGWDQILGVLPSDFVHHEDLSDWVHRRSGNRLLGFSLDSRDRNSPGKTLTQCGVEPHIVVELLTRLAEVAWDEEYKVMEAVYGFRPNLGGRTDAPTLGPDAMRRRIDAAIQRGDLPTIEQWRAERPSDWLSHLIGVAN